MKEKPKASELLKKYKKKIVEYVLAEIICPDCDGEKFGVYNPCATCKGEGVIKKKMTKEQKEWYDANKQTKNRNSRSNEKNNLS